MLTRRFFLNAGLGVTLGGMAIDTLASRATAKDKMPEAPLIGFANWSNEEPLYLLYPGDKLEISVPGAPELSRQTQVGPDGRITLALVGQIMAAYRSVPQLQEEIERAYAGTLRDPNVTVYPGETAPMRVLVGGEVKNPGWVDMSGDMDALQATFAAGGFTHGAKTHQVMIIRRGRNGEAMRRIVDLQDPLKGKAGQMVALRRFDIVYVPRTNVAEAGVFMEQWVNNLIPGGIMNYFTYRTFGS
ncbi:MAG: polysaccharide biosynthesis/export family protein [Asticcacaulis sp.]|uniref:polysaccharide biosynthesis/export family protein n=1 Tax=Asticcacaulis sp. TaxID=1872648 RepID=UPI0039E4CC6B